MFDATAHHRKLSGLRNYFPRQGLVNDLEWRPTIGGHTVFDEAEDDRLMGIMVGKVSEHKLKVGPAGNFIGEGYGTLPKAKYQLFLTRPITAPFKEDFERAYSLLSHLQDVAAVSRKKKDMLILEGGSKMIRFTKNVFEERVRISRPIVDPKVLTVLKGKIVSDSPQPVKSDLVYLEDVNGSRKLAC